MLVLGRGALQSTGGSLSALMLNMLMVVLASVVMLRMNWQFNFFGYSCDLHATLYVLLNILFLPQYCHGVRMAVVMVLLMTVCLWIIFSIYDKPKYTREIYVIVAICSTFTLVRPLMCVTLPVLVFGLVYMQVFSPRALFAILLGIITPWWLLIVPLEFGWLELAPFSISPVWMTDSLSAGDITAMVMLVLGVVLGVTNFFSTLSKRQQIYSYFVFTSWMLLGLSVVAILDFEYVMVYLPMVVLFMAVHLSLNYSLIPHKRKYLIFLVILTIIIACFFMGLTDDSYEVVDRTQYTLCQGGA